jgi:NADH-quinone oxidoreductase subunit F
MPSAQARAAGLLGDRVMDRSVRFDIDLRRGAGAYICGEETALFNSVEGFRGEPRNKPPFPVQSGLFGKPTVVNNVETLVNVLDIVREGGAAFAGSAPASQPGRSCSASPAARRGRDSTKCRSASRSAS